MRLGWEGCRMSRNGMGVNRVWEGGGGGREKKTEKKQGSEVRWGGRDNKDYMCQNTLLPHNIC